MRLLSGGLVLLALGAFLFASATPALAGSIEDVSDTEREGAKKPLVFEDDNWSLASQTVTIDNVAREVIVGFVTFTSIKGSTVANTGTDLIKDIGASQGTKIGSGTVNTDLSGWFVAMIKGATLGSDPEGGTFVDTVFFEPVPVGVKVTVFEYDTTTGAELDSKVVTWSPVAGFGTIFDLYEDSSDPDTSNSIAAYDSIVGDAGSTHAASIGFKGSASTSATYANGGEYFANSWTPDGVLPVIKGRPDLLWGSLNVLGTPAGPFDRVEPNDTGNDVYLQGSFGSEDKNWFAIGDVDAKILLVPLPGAAWGGLLLLGALGLGRNIRRRKLNS